MVHGFSQQQPAENLKYNQLESIYEVLPEHIN
jgi:hypothetical protein